MLTRGAVAMDLLFPDDEGRTHIGKQIGKQSQADQPDGLDHGDKTRPDQGFNGGA